MKKILFAIILTIHFGGAFAQPPKVIIDFMKELKKNDWTYDNVTGRFAVPMNHKNSSNFDETRYPEVKTIFEASLKELSNQLKTVDLSKISVVRYDLAEEKYHTMFLDETLQKQAYVVSDGHGFCRYFLLKGDKIASWITFEDNKVFYGYF